MKYCSNCGSGMGDEYRFCPDCGAESFVEKQPEESQSRQEYKQEQVPEVEQVRQAPPDEKRQPPPVDKTKHQWQQKLEEEQPVKQTQAPQGNKGKTPLWAPLGLLAAIVLCLAALLMTGVIDVPWGVGGNNDDATAASAPAGSLTITDVYSSGFPNLFIVAETTDVGALTPENLTAYVNAVRFPIKSVQQIESNGFLHKYQIQIDASEMEDINGTQTIRLSYNNLADEYAYELSNTREDLALTVRQVDTSNYPEISVYFTMQNSFGEYIVADEPRFFNLIDNSGGKSAPEVINSLRTTKDNSEINIALVIDRSGSMDTNRNFSTAQDMAVYFLDLLNYSKGDAAAVISFDDSVYINHFFSRDSADLKSAVRGMYTDGATALYDALHVSLLETSGQSGSKCVVALTDGQDNSSNISPRTVIDKSLELGIPIYIIGLGNENFTESRMIATESGAYFSQIDYISEIKAIYDDLFRIQQNQMVLTYVISDSADSAAQRDVRLQFRDNSYVGDEDIQFQYQNIVNPNYSQNELDINIDNMNDVERAIYYYEHQFVKAVDTYDFNDLRDYIDPNGGLFELQKNLIENYRDRDVKERLLYYKINSLRQLSGGSYEAEVNEQFYIRIGEEQASYKEFVNTYIVNNTANGYKVSELTSLQTISDRSVDIYIQ